MNKFAEFKKKTKMSVYQKHKVPMTPEENKLIHERKAVWSGNSPAVFKAVDKDGDTAYITHTHRAMNVCPTLKGAISRFHSFIKSTASEAIDENMEKVARDNSRVHYEIQIEKTAQSRWRKHIDGLSEDDMYDFGAHVSRNRPQVFNNPGARDVRSEIGNNKAEYKRLLSGPNALGRGGIAKVVEDAQNTPIPQLGEKELKRRKAVARERKHDRADLKWISESSKGPNSMNPSSLSAGPEDLVDIIHGGNRAKAEAFLQGGNGGSKLEGVAKTVDGNVSEMGLQFHSKNGQRAPMYANRAAEHKGGSPAILEGKIKRKYLHPNPSRSSGGGDEYGVPSEYFSKIQQGKVYNPQTGQVYLNQNGEAPNKLPFGRTKTPGAPTAETKSMMSNKNNKKFVLGSGSPVESASRPTKKNIPTNLSLVPLGTREGVMAGSSPVQSPHRPRGGAITLRQSNLPSGNKPPDFSFGSRSSQQGMGDIKERLKNLNKRRRGGQYTGPLKNPLTTIDSGGTTGLVNSLNKNTSKSKLGLGLGAGALALGAGAGLYAHNRKKKGERASDGL